VQRQRTGKRTRRPPPAKSNVATIAERVSRLWTRRGSGAGIEPPLADADWEHRLESCEARIEHLEMALEGLQDALYRHEILDEKNIAELRRRTHPEQMARDLSQHTRMRGL
jgi:uncharacterized coiled-coil protein SlyX